MSIAFKFRNIGGGYVDTSVSVGGGSFDLGLLSESERESLASDLRSAADELSLLDSQQTEAYAEGRKDEREEWLPVLEALQSCLSLLECHEHELRRAPMSQEPECMRAARAAIAKVTGEGA